jgi:hypothetical protein
MKDYDSNTQVKTIPLCISKNKKKTRIVKCVHFLGTLIPNLHETKLDYDSLRVSFGLICLTFGREDVDSQTASSGGITTNTPTYTHSFLSAKRLQEFNAIDAVENISTCTGTTMGGEMNK